MAHTEPDRQTVQRLTSLDTIIHAPARLALMTYLYVVDSADYVFLMRLTDLTWGNLASHLNKLEEAGYVAIEKEFRNKKPYSMLRLTEAGRLAYRAYKAGLQDILASLPE
jgi:DNA-binding MarR family transcriptional regulator